MAIVLGGNSAEREISQMTGESVARALSERGYNVSVLRADRDLPGRFAASRIDVVFNALHGTFGEDGCVQGLFEMLRIPYTGSGVLASAIGMDKAISKRIFESHELPTPEWRTVAPDEAVDDSFKLPGKLPVVVKPTGQGSSVGVSIVRQRSDLTRAIENARVYGPVLIERFVPGKEVTVGLLAGRPLTAMEVIPKGEFHSYEVKYTPGREEFVLPAALSKKAFARVLELAAATYAAIGADTYARVDFRVDEKERPFVIEINTLPGLTNLSYLPKMAAHVGIGYGELVERILDGASLKVKEAPA
ncbi:MAG: D-alanine-D-alanine ligase [Candidatus Binatota bacterium]|nr:D-alanine-D-alanine ligase [Candidatus Binatota bacterium]